MNYYDPEGHFGIFTFGFWAIIGIVSATMVAGGGAQLVSNALAGKTGTDLWRGVAGAALGQQQMLWHYVYHHLLEEYH